MVSLLLRPLVCPAVPKVTPEKRMEVRFFAPGGLVSNLDFVESIFGNAGDPYLPENDAGLDVDRWTGHTGCVILAPHLTRLRKKDLGLPHVSRPRRRARRHVLGERGEPTTTAAFKITSRGTAGRDGHADRRQLLRLLQEGSEDADQLQRQPLRPGGGGARRRRARVRHLQPRRPLHAGPGAGRDRRPPLRRGARSCSAIVRGVHPDGLRDRRDLPRDPLRAGGHGDRRPPAGHHLDQATARSSTSSSCPAGSTSTRAATRCGWRSTPPRRAGAWSARCPRAPSATSPAPSRAAASRRSARAWSTRCCRGPIFVRSFDEDMELVEEIFERSYDDAPDHRRSAARRARPILSPERSLGSVIKLLTPSPADFTPEYNAWLESIPNHVRALVFIIKRFYRPEWGDDWRAHFSVDIINGAPGHELKYERPEARRQLPARRARRATAPGGPTSCGRTSSRPTRCRWRTTSPRRSWCRRAGWSACPASTTGTRASSSRRTASSGCSSGPTTRSIPGSTSRPRRTCPARALLLELPAARPRATCSDIVEDVALHDAFTAADARARRPERRARPTAATRSARRSPRLVGGKPTKNPRYLQIRPDLARPRDRYVAEMGARLSRRLPLHAAGALPGDQRALGPAEQPARAPASGRSASTARSTTRSCPSCSWTTSAR